VFRFGVPEALYGYLLVPLALVFLWYVLRMKRAALQRFGELDLVRRLAQTVSRRGQAIKSVLVIAALASLITALARPQYGTRVETVRREGQDIVVALDLSLSMLAEDIAPSRLAKAKLSVGRLIDRLDGDRIGLVAFAGDAFVQSPLTTEYAAAHMFLNAMEPGIMPVQGTNLGAALATALGMYDEESRQYRVLVVMTDGEDHEGAIDEAVGRAKEEGVRIYAVGMGAVDGVPIPEFDERGVRRGFKRDADGNVVTTRLDEATLQRIAQETGGRYSRASVRGTELDALADELASSGGRELAAREVTQYEEQFQVFLGLSLILLFAEVFVPDRRRLRGVWTGRFQ